MSVGFNTGSQTVNQQYQPSQLVPQAETQNSNQTVGQSQVQQPQQPQPQQVDAQTYIGQVANAQQSVPTQQVVDTYNQPVNNQSQQSVAEISQAPEQVEPVVKQPIIKPAVTVQKNLPQEQLPRFMQPVDIYGPKPYAMPEIRFIEEQENVLKSDKAAYIIGGIVSTAALLACLFAPKKAPGTGMFSNIKTLFHKLGTSSVQTMKKIKTLCVTPFKNLVNWSKKVVI